MKKKIIYLGTVIIVLVVAILSIIFTKGKQIITSDNPEFGKYIAAYTSGIISKKSTIKIRFVNEIDLDLPEFEKPGRVGSVNNSSNEENSIDEDLFDFEPKIKGTSYWLDEKTIEFKPDEDLPSNTSFFVSFHLNKLIDVPKDLKNFNFKFQTIKQSFELNIEEVKTTDKKTLRWQKILGIIQTSDAENTAQIKKILQASQEGEQLTINWKSNSLPFGEGRGGAGLKHFFEIDSVSRKKTASEVLLEWNGKPIDVEKKGEMKIEIPALGDFKFISARIIHHPEQYLQFQFSDPLQENQELTGLINIVKISSLRFIIEDNIIKAYPPERLKGTYQVTIHEGIKNILGYRLKDATKLEMVFEEIKPSVRLVSKGVILPNSPDGLIVPFEAVNLRAVDVRIMRIYENNITQFLQVNDLEGAYQLKRVGKPVVQKTIRLDQSNIVDLGRWNRYSLDLNELIEAEPGAIYRITIGFRMKHSLYSCGEEDEEDEELKDFDESLETLDDETEASFWDYYDNYYYGYGDYYWEHRDDPCHKAYYGARRSVSQNIIASNLGLIAKKGNDGSIKIFVTDIRTTEPLKNVKIGIYDYQQQLLQSVVTDNDGIADFTNLEEPYFIIASLDKQRGYLRLYDGASLSLSRFDISGVSVIKGLKGFIYGERGVWRPGDSLFVTFILEDENNSLPAQHPVIFELRNPHYQLIKRIVERKNSDGFYSFNFKTKQDDPTGNWNAKVTVGGVSFHKTLKIETIKPNRLKIDFEFKTEYLAKNKTTSANMNVKWLHGAIAKDLDVIVDVILSEAKTYFEKYKDFVFDDPTKKFYSEQETVFDGSTDEQGNALVNVNIKTGDEAPGKLKATFITKVFEKGGNFSIDQFSLPYYPYESFIGIKLPKGDKTRGMLLTDTSHVVEIVTVDSEGKRVIKSHSVEMEFYKLDWRWWWDQTSDELTNFIGRSYVQPYQKKTIHTKNGKGKWKIRINYPDWGRYLVRAHDLVSGHSTAKIVYIDWPGWAGREQKDHPGGVAMLSFTSDKEKYTIGEQVKLTIPTSKKGRALINIESGTKVINSYWLETQAGQTQFTFTATEDMTPNIYVNIHLLQPHAQTANDLPIRLYGVLPILIEDPATHLEPILTMPDVLRSEESVKISVKEKNRKEMTYTLAMVDEGLLDLTRFKTPDPWNHFYAKEALGVKTWDIYDWVIGAYGGELERLLSIGGGGEEIAKKGKKATRFKPMVKFLGPFHLKSGKENTHTIDIPRYIGSVRTMVIAGYNEAYGSVEKTTPVKKPLMLLGTLPRVLGPGETVKLPVSVFAMEKNIKDVKVQVKTNKLLKVIGGGKMSIRSIRFDETGEQIVEFDLKVQSKLGIAKVEIIATSGTEKATYEIELDVRNPNPKVVDVIAQIIEPGQTWKSEFKPVGIAGTNKGVLEVSSIPPLNLEKRLKFLIRYPYGCIEQTTSSVFPQLYLAKLLDLNKTRKKDITRNIKYGIQRINAFQQSNGGLGSWPNSNNIDVWSTNYAGHFILEANKKGYTIPSGFIKKWKKYQRNKAVNWTDDGGRSQLIQAYRLYTLALANSPEIGAMNRLRGKSNLSADAKWRLAAAYLLAGKPKTANKLVENLSIRVKSYNEMSYTYGSGTRDKAMILETLCMLNKRKAAFTLLKEISGDLSSERWLSTQTTAYSLIAVSKYVDKNITSSQLKYSYSINDGKLENILSTSPVSQNDISIKSANEQLINIKNTSDGVIFARLILEGIPEIGETTDAENDLRMKLTYKLMDGTVIDPGKIEQGTDFIAEVKIIHPGRRGTYKQMALTQIFPSGWEIINVRMLDVGNFIEASIPTYQDIRDDRVYTYFDIKTNQTKTFRVLLNASYVGRYYLPTVYSEAMYDATINARKHGKWVRVVKAGG